MQLKHLLAVATFAIGSTLGPSSAASTRPVSGSVLRVGPTQAFGSIQAAILAAVPGDLILVDPGAYAEFVVDRGVSIVAVGAEFTVLETTSADPAILICGIPSTEQVTIIGARIDHAISFNTPAVRLRNNAGAIRLHQLNIRESADLVGTLAHAALEIDNTDTFWIHDSDVWTGSPKQAQHISSVGVNEVVNGVEIVDSDGVIQNSKLLGYNGTDSSTFGGDAVRVLGNSSVWLIDDLVQSPTRTILRGGDARIGGNAIQMFGVKKKQGRITTCGTVAFERGSGSVQNGGYFAINGDLGVITNPFGFSYRLPQGCGAFEFAETTVASAKVSIGTLIQLRVRSQSGGPFLTVLSTNTRYSRSLRGFNNRSILDVFAPTVVTVARGVLAPTVVQKCVVGVPNDLCLIGTQLVFQTVTGALGSNQDALSFGALVVLTP